MRGGPRSYAEQTRTKLLELWGGEESYGRALGCLTTTFTFDAELFEEQCLARFLGIQSNPNETAKAYLIEREEKLSQCFACVLVDRGHAAPDRSLRWHLLPVALPGGGVLHAKLTLLVWEDLIRVLIGSANLTEPGYRRNQEMMAVLEFNPHEGGAPRELLTQCLAFIDQVRRYAPGYDRADAGPQAALTAFLQSVRTRIEVLPPTRREDAQCALLSLVPGGPSIVAQLKDHWRGPAPDRAWVVSPFFDVEDGANDTAKRFAELLTNRGPRSLFFCAPGRKLPDGKMQLDAPACLRDSSHPALEHGFTYIPERYENDGKDIDRPLHAKALWLEREERALCMLGSSNFTAAGLGLHPKHNIELNVTYVIGNVRSQFARLCLEAWPRDEDLPDLADVQFLEEGQSDSGEMTDGAVLPAAFGLALFVLDTRGARLELEINAEAPAEFTVQAQNGRFLVRGADWWRDGKPQKVIVSWETRRPPSAIEVHWQDDEGGECIAPWIVNVADASSLPPPDELGSLSLEELMEILTSARPLHEVVTRILERREKKGDGDLAVAVDPHRKVDTSQFLLRRMRRVADALEGMRRRLEQPLGSTEALRWRLRGPIGPLALAKRLAEEDPKGAAFMISEVATTLHSVSWRPLGSLGSREVSAEVGHTIQALHELAQNVPAPGNLAKYVRDSFKELMQ